MVQLKKYMVLCLLYLILLICFPAFPTVAADTVDMPFAVGVWNFDTETLFDSVGLYEWETPVVTSPEVRNPVTNGYAGKIHNAWRIDKKDYLDPTGVYNGTNPDYSAGISMGTLPAEMVGIKEFTLTAWIKPTEFKYYQTIFYLSDTNKDRNALNVKLENGNLKPDMDDGTTSCNTNHPVSAGEWQHLAATFNFNAGGNVVVSFYINGALVGTRRFPSVYSLYQNGLPNGMKLYIGGDRNARNSFNGYIDDFRVYQRALNRTQIAVLYESYFKLPEAAGIWSFDGDTLSDSAGNYNWETPVITSTDVHMPVTKGIAGKTGNAWNIRKIDYYDPSGNNPDYSAGIDLGVLPSGVTGTKELTISGWIKPDGYSNYQTVFYLYDPTRGVSAINIKFENDRLKPDMDGGVTGSNTDVHVPVNAWRQVTAVFQFNNSSGYFNATFYLNGVLIGSKTYPAIYSPYNEGIPDGLRLYIGSDNNARNSFNGLIDDVRIYKSALTEAQVVRLFEGDDTTLYVSPNGDDNGDGSVICPFKTVERARRAVACRNSSMDSDITVYILPGTYLLEDSLRFTAEDSGTNGFNVIYRGAGEGRTVLSGGKKIEGWTLYDDKKNIWRAPANGIRSRQMFVNGKRVWRASTTNVPKMKDSDVPGIYETVGENVFAGFRNPTEIELVGVGVWNNWPCSEYRSPIKAIDGKKLILSDANLSLQMTLEKMTFDRMENVFEYLDTPGEWYLDSVEDVVYYMPEDDEYMPNTEVIMPVLETLVEISGMQDKSASNIRFEGLTFAYNTWFSPSNPNYGFPQMQAGFSRDNIPGYYDNFVKSAVFANYCENICFYDNVFEHLGGAGLWMCESVRNTDVDSNTFKDISHNGIMLSHVVGLTPVQDCENVRIENNLICGAGIEYLGCVGIFASYPRNSVIIHNEICDIPYVGIFHGWGWMNDWQIWTEGDISTQKRNNNNKILNNYVHDVMTTPSYAIAPRKLDDGGGIYTLGIQPGLEIAGNVVQKFGQSSLSLAYYLDDGTRFVSMHDNVGYDGNLALYSKGANNVIYNNYFDSSFDKTTIGDQRVGHSQYMDLPEPEGNENVLYDNITISNGKFPAHIITNAGLYPKTDIKADFIVFANGIQTDGRYNALLIPENFTQGDATVVIAVYDGKEIKDVFIEKINVMNGNAVSVLSSPMMYNPGNDIRLFVWRDMDSIIPLILK